MMDKIKSISCHKSQNPERFVKLIRLMNSYRAAQCNAPEGEYAEAYFFEKSFPFSDIRKILPDFGGIDISPVILIILLIFFRNLLFEYSGVLNFN